MDNKAIIGFGLRIIWKIMEISEGCFPTWPMATADKTLFDLHNSLDGTKAKFNNC